MIIIGEDIGQFLKTTNTRPQNVGFESQKHILHSIWGSMTQVLKLKVAKIYRFIDQNEELFMYVKKVINNDK